MEFLNPKKRKAHRRKLFIGYGLVGIALAMLTIIVVFATYGFDVDRKTGKVIQNGMMVVDSHPVSARIILDGKDMGATSKRLSLPASQYHLELTRDGYRSWSHDINLAGGSIEQLVYPFLFPSNLSTTALRNYAAKPQLVSQSPDRKWLLVTSPSNRLGMFDVVNLNDEKNPSTEAVLPGALISAGKTHEFSVVEWSSDNDNVLLEHRFDGKAEFIVLNHQDPTKSKNVTKLFPERPFTAASLYDKHTDRFYLYNGPNKTLYLGDSDSQSVTTVVSSVLAYKTYQRDTLLYVTAAKDTTQVDIHMRHKDKDRTIKTVAVSSRYLLDIADFNGKMYVAVGSTDEQKAYIFLEPIAALGDKTKDLNGIRTLRLDGLSSMAFSTNARFLQVQSGGKFAVFDAETGRQFQYDTEIATKGSMAATWMDGHRLTLVGADKLVYVFDFDGRNAQKLNPGLAGSGVFFDRDHTALYTIAPGAEDKIKAALTRTELRIVQ